VDTLDCTSVKEERAACDTGWPDFPVALKEAVGLRLGNTLFAGLGSAGQAWFALDIMATSKAWQLRAAFPFEARNGAVAAAADGKIYVFGGSGRSAQEPRLHQFDSICCYDPHTDGWTELRARLPIGMLGASAAAIGSSIYIFGGYNKPQFDQLFREYEAATPEQQGAILHAFMDRRAEDFAWNDHVWEFDTREHSWHDRGPAPHAATCGSAVIANGAQLWLASGEVKPGLRTASVKHASIENGAVHWQAENNLPAQDGPQEGIAAAFAGKCGIVKILAGGTNFIGARHSYQTGKMYAHQGLNKRWRAEIYLLKNEMWECAGYLPQGRASGLAFEIEQGLLLIGGDTQNGQPCLETWLLSYEESTGITISSNKLK
jgi:N-acetylneuraminate epimerase